MGEPVVDLLAEEFSSIRELASALTPEQWQATTECPGWTVQDQLAHVIGTESMLAGRPRPAASEATSKAPHVKNEIGGFNESWVESFRNRSPEEVRATLDALLDERLEQLRALTPEQWDQVGPTPVGQAPYREFMNVRVMDIWVHEQDIRRAIGRPGHLRGPVVEHSIGRFLSAMPFAVGKKAGAPKGSSVVFSLTGDAGRTFAVVVGDRAGLADEVPADPTVTLRMDVETWWCLSLGRVDGPSTRAAGKVEIVGDEALGERVVDNLSFMI
jgi:uncharacterized protein (TIGR03083 family)